jgi:hypothetical protein
MSTQPAALILADWLEDQYDPTHNQEDAAAELRRLSALNGKLLATNGKLLEALKAMLEVWEEDPAYGAMHADKARATIKKAEGKV